MKKLLTALFILSFLTIGTQTAEAGFFSNIKTRLVDLKTNISAAVLSSFTRTGTTTTTTDAPTRSTSIVPETVIQEDTITEEVLTPTTQETTNTIETQIAPVVRDIQVITPTKLQLGDKNDEVRQLQETLINLNFLPKDSADGSFGQITRDAVKSFQLSNNLYADGVAGAITLEKIKDPETIRAVSIKKDYEIQSPVSLPASSTFQYKFGTTANKKGEANFDLPILPFNEKENGITTNLGQYRDSWGYPVQPNAYQKLNQKITQTTQKKLSFRDTVSNFFTIKKASAFDIDPTIPGLVNCRANTGVTGYFKAYFEDMAVKNGTAYDDAILGPVRRSEVCNVLQDIATLIKLDQTNTTPDIIFMVNPGNIPPNALAAASSYFGYYSVGTDNGALHKHIISHLDPTPGLGNFDALIITNFSTSIKWDVDSTLNANSYSFYTVMYHEVLHTLGFRGLLPATISSTNNVQPHTTFDLNTYKNSTLTNPFFDKITEYLKVPVGAPSPWFITNTAVYKGTKNIVGATPDGTRAVFSPLAWQQGSSLSHFDMLRATGKTYVMNPSISTNTKRSIDIDEKEVLCHEGYMVLGMTGCEKATPIAVDDSILMSGTSMCIQPLLNDSSFAGGTLSLQSVTPITLQTGDVLSYYTSGDCTTGSQGGALNAKSIKITFGASTAQRILQYKNMDSVSNRISNLATVMLDPVLGCADDYKYVTQWGKQGTGDGEFNAWIFGIVIDSFNNIYAVDTGNDRIQQFTSNGVFITKWGINGSGDGQLKYPSGIAQDIFGNVYVTDRLNNRVQEFTSSGLFIKMFGWGVKDGSNQFQVCTSNCQSGIVGSGNGQFDIPESIAVDSLGNIYVGDMNNDRIQKFNSSFQYLLRWGNYGSGNGQFSRPVSMAIDSVGDIYVLDFDSFRVQKFTSNGIYITQWGSKGINDGQFYMPTKIALDSSENVYVADTWNHRIQKFTSNGVFITKWGINGSGDGQFLFPEGIAIDSLGNVYVGDEANHRIQKFATSCPVTPKPPVLNTISGKVYNDLNKNGAFDASTESGLDGIQVGLFKAGQTTPVIQTQTTQNVPKLGEYSFTGVPDDSYYVAIIKEGLFKSVTQPTTLWPLYSNSHIHKPIVAGGQMSISNNFGITLTDNYTGTIKIIKDFQPGFDKQSFSFTTNIPIYHSTAKVFTLSDSNDELSKPPTVNTKTFSSIPIGPYTVIENATAGYKLDSISCTDASGDTTTDMTTGTAKISLADGETVTCTFVNSKLPPPVCSDQWIQKKDFGGTKRWGASSFSIGNKGYVGLGWDSSTSYKKDFWEYNPTSNVWTQKADFGGIARNSAVGFSIGTKGYIGTGSNTNDFWEYNLATNKWTQKASLGGAIRFHATGFSIGNKGYIVAGRDAMNNKLQDFWEYNSLNDTWTKKSDFPGKARDLAVGFSIGTKGYVGTGWDSTSKPLKDFWEYNPTSDTWTQKKDFAGSPRNNAVGFSIGSKGYIGTGSTANDFFEYDPSNDTWTKKANFGGAYRANAFGFSIGNKGYVGTGAGASGSMKDFWEYCP